METEHEWLTIKLKIPNKMSCSFGGKLINVTDWHSNMESDFSQFDDNIAGKNVMLFWANEYMYPITRCLYNITNDRIILGILRRRYKSFLVCFVTMFVNKFYNVLMWQYSTIVSLSEDYFIRPNHECSLILIWIYFSSSL